LQILVQADLASTSFTSFSHFQRFVLFEKVLPVYSFTLGLPESYPSSIEGAVFPNTYCLRPIIQQTQQQWWVLH
jgi:hypothetical protein